MDASRWKVLHTIRDAAEFRYRIIKKTLDLTEAHKLKRDDFARQHALSKLK